MVAPSPPTRESVPLGERPREGGTVSHGAAASGRRYGNLGFRRDGCVEDGSSGFDQGRNLFPPRTSPLLSSDEKHRMAPRDCTACRVEKMLRVWSHFCGKSSLVLRRERYTFLKYYNIIGPQVRRIRYARQWSQSKLAAKLQCAGWDISRSGVSKIEARLKFVLDFELEYLVEVLRVELKELFPNHAPQETAHDRLTRLMNQRF